ncbi:MAG: hypothetical protein ACTSXG_02170 [Alphaproteobacteria bacterium]
MDKKTEEFPYQKLSSKETFFHQKVLKELGLKNNTIIFNIQHEWYLKEKSTCDLQQGISAKNIKKHPICLDIFLYLEEDDSYQSLNSQLYLSGIEQKEPFEFSWKGSEKKALEFTIDDSWQSVHILSLKTLNLDLVFLTNMKAQIDLIKSKNDKNITIFAQSLLFENPHIDVGGSFNIKTEYETIFQINPLKESFDELNTRVGVNKDVIITSQKSSIYNYGCNFSVGNSVLQNAYEDNVFDSVLGTTKVLQPEIDAYKIKIENKRSTYIRGAKINAFTLQIKSEKDLILRALREQITNPNTPVTEITAFCIPNVEGRTECFDGNLMQELVNRVSINSTVPTTFQMQIQNNFQPAQENEIQKKSISTQCEYSEMAAKQALLEILSELVHDPKTLIVLLLLLNS